MSSTTTAATTSTATAATTGSSTSSPPAAAKRDGAAAKLKAAELAMPAAQYPPMEHVRVEMRGGEPARVALVTLDRPRALNALNGRLVGELYGLLRLLDADPRVHAIVLTGSARAFAAGADIKEMAGMSVAGMWDPSHSVARLAEMTLGITKPIVAAVNGVALGGGCELALMCDIIVAGAGARFGQPEVRIGTVPGAGGTQRLVAAVGKSRAMEMVLTGAHI